MKSTKFLLTLLAFALPAFAQTSAVDQRIVAEALKPSPIEANLRRLTDEIGGRVPGTPAMERAVQWGLEAFKAAGADDVHEEEFTMPAGWREGPTTFDVYMTRNGSVVGDGTFRARVHAIAWSPSYPRHKTRVVLVGSGSEQDFAKAGDVRNAIVLVGSHVLKTWDDLFNEYLDAPPVVERAVKANAAAIAWTSTRERGLLYRHINTLTGRIDRIPQVLLAREDSLRIQRLLESGVTVEADLQMNNSTSGPIKSKNVVAEIRGSEHPEEWVLIGAHLDSWELGTGALDNGCNAALVIDALRAIKAAGIRPKRSIRFVLFSGEEQGMLGSWAYVEQHRAELDRALLAMIFDEGSGAATGFSLGGRNDLRPAIQPLLAPYAQWGVTMLTDDAPVGTDNFDFLLEGVPNLIANQQEANYIVNYHATSDTFDKVDIPQLKKHVALAAGVAVAIADAPTRPGPRQSRSQIETLMGPTHLEEQMKIFGMWDDWSSGKRGRKE